MPPIALFSPAFRVDETLAQIRECLEKGWTGVGYKTLDFENAWRDYTALPHAHFLASATAGLHLAVRLLKEQYGWNDGDEIITTPLTFVSTNHAILYERMTPVFADVDQFLCLDPASVESRITQRTRAVMFVGFGGSTGSLRHIAELCRARGLKLILDAAHMAGTRWSSGVHVGREADATIFSYHAVKNLPTADGGMICLPDSDMDSAARRLSWMGINKNTYDRAASGAYRWQYDVESVGFKYHGNSIMAAIGIVALKYLDADNEYRRQLAAWYDERLSGVDGIEHIPIPEDCVPSRHLYQIALDRRDELLTALARAEISAGVHYQDNTSYRMYAYGAGTCPVAHRASERIVSLPMSIRLTQADVDRVCDVIGTFH